MLYFIIKYKYKNNAPKWQVIAHKVGALIHTNMKPHYYFQISEANIDQIEDKSTDGEMYLSCLIGHTLAAFMEDRNNPLELVRINRGEGLMIVARRRFNDIKAEIYDRK